MTTVTGISQDIRERVDALDWNRLGEQLDDAGLRESFYPHLAPVASRWAQRLRGEQPSFPSEHEELLQRCHAAGQERPTPLILRYREGDWNALHQDPYEQGAFVIFPTVDRPQQGAAGYYRVRMRHGVSTVTASERTALGVIFHDAK
jgi:uncharacterized protein